MTPAILRTAGEALYGPRWQSALARDLGVSDRTIRRWLAGDSPIPPGLPGDMHRVCDAWERRIETARGALPA